MTDQALAVVKPKPKEPFRQRLIRSLLYGRNVDRSAKARARVGFAMVAFAAIYGVIAARLIMFAVVGDNHGARRTASQDAIVIMGPKVSLERKVSLEMLRAGGAASCPIFYLNYSPNPLEEPSPDTIGSALKAYSAASKYQIERPRDFAAAMKDILLRLGKQPTSVAAFSK